MMHHAGIMKYNTTIRGASSTVPDKDTLLGILGLVDNDMPFFKIEGSDILCEINSSYNMPVNSFRTSSTGKDCTSFLDLEGKVIALNGFNFLSSSLTECYFPSVTDLDNANSFNNTGLLVVNDSNFPSLTAITGNSIFNNCSLITELNLPNLTSINGSSNFQNNTSLISIDIDSCTVLGAYTFANCTASGLSISALNLQTINGQRTFWNTKIKDFIFPELIEITNGNAVTFINCSYVELIDIKKCKDLGNATATTGVFSNIKTNCVINVHEDLATNNSGNADGNLVYAKNTRGATVNFYDDNGDHVSTL